MKPLIKQFLLLLIPLILISLAIHFYSANSLRVETQYATHFYIKLSKVLRYLFGWIPFSFGDIIYGAFFIWLLIHILKFIRNVFSREKRISLLKSTVPFLGKLLIFMLGVYIIFNLFWGINYNRMGIASQLNLDTTAYTQAELKNINLLLVNAVNESKAATLKKPLANPDFNYIKQELEACYDSATKLYPIPVYSPSSLKSSLWGWLGNYTGFTGYYNPFTGEAQVNTTVPFFEQPFTACHEVAHQLGYAKEMEANFVGFLAATSTTDNFFKYSVHMDLFLYANRNLFTLDSTLAKSNYDSLSAPVKADIKERILFSRNHKSFLQPIFLYIYEKFLWSNQQPQGLLSYDEVTGFIISYYRKYKKI